MKSCFVDYRNPNSVEHRLRPLLAQRVIGLALGYEDLNDHDELRRDPLMALLVGCSDGTGARRARRARRRNRDRALAGSSTLNRLELGDEGAAWDRYKRIVGNPQAMDRLLVDVFMESYAEPPEAIWLDLDATDDPLHGNQQGRFFHGYYGQYCYLPLYIFCGEHLLCARLREADVDPAAGSVEELEWIVGQIRTRWPSVPIVVRGDSGFCREAIMAWCEQHGVEYVLGLGGNARLVKRIDKALRKSRARHVATGQPSRRFRSFRYRTRKTWGRARRVVGKAEWLAKGANPRFVVTSLPCQVAGAQHLYEDLYCARGEMENRIKEQQLGLFADRTSSASMRANQLRLYFASFAYVLMQGPATAGTGRYRLGQGAMHHDPVAMAEACCTCTDHRAQGLAVVLRVLPPCRGLRANPGAPAHPSALASNRVKPLRMPFCPASTLAEGFLRTASAPCLRNRAKTTASTLATIHSKPQSRLAHPKNRPQRQIGPIHAIGEICGLCDRQRFIR